MWTVPADTVEVFWVLIAGGELMVFAQDGFVFGDGTTQHSFGAAPDSETALDPVQSAQPRIDGTLLVGRTVTAVPGQWEDGAALSVTWLVDGVVAGSGPRYALSAEQVGAQLILRVTGAKVDRSDVTGDSEPTLRVARLDQPKIVGVAAVGQTLRASVVATPGAELAHQWLADGKVIKGAISSAWKITSAQQGKRLSVRVRGSQSGYPNTEHTSAETAKVTVAGTPLIGGTAVVGATLTAKPGTWAGKTTFRYQWYANGTALAGATKPSLRLTGGHRDRSLTVTVTGRKPGYATVVRTSRATQSVQQAPSPTISGSTRVTSALRAKPGAWSNGTRFSYQWYVGSKAIKNATGATLRLTAAVAGKRVTVKVTGRKSGYPTLSRTSKASGRVGYPNRTDPVSEWNCPAWAPIKGNADSGIYHVPGGAFYTRTKPEDCFRTESAARAAGYRKSKV